jgi:hypothetical protein
MRTPQSNRLALLTHAGFVLDLIELRSVAFREAALAGPRRPTWRIVCRELSARSAANPKAAQGVPASVAAPRTRR